MDHDYGLGRADLASDAFNQNRNMIVGLIALNGDQRDGELDSHTTDPRLTLPGGV
jgi:hypothetical protein